MHEPEQSILRVEVDEVLLANPRFLLLALMRLTATIDHRFHPSERLVRKRQVG
jgi:hypothetical protein